MIIKIPHQKITIGRVEKLTSAGSTAVGGALRLRFILLRIVAASTALPLTRSEPAGEEGREHDAVAFATFMQISNQFSVAFSTFMQI